jgi:hypothetical protein
MLGKTRRANSDEVEPDKSAALLRSCCKFCPEEACVRSNSRFSQILTPISVWVLETRRPERGEAACATLRMGCTLFLGGHAAQNNLSSPQKLCHFLPTIPPQYRLMCKPKREQTVAQRLSQPYGHKKVKTGPELKRRKCSERHPLALILCRFTRSQGCKLCTKLRHSLLVQYGARITWHN